MNFKCEKDGSEADQKTSDIQENNHDVHLSLNFSDIKYFPQMIFIYLDMCLSQRFLSL